MNAPDTSLIINVFIPVQLRQLTGHRDHILVAKKVVAAISNADEKAITLRHLVEALEIGSPGIKARLVDATGIRRFIVIFVDGEDARTLRDERAGREAQLNTKDHTDPLDLIIADAKEVSILPAIAGG